MSKFKIGDTVHYMDSNKPTTSEIKAILTIEGEIEIGYRKHKTETGKPKTVYIVGYSTHLEENDAFKTSEELKNNLFSINIEP